MKRSLIWDLRDGVVVDVDTGEVVDRLYEDEVFPYRPLDIYRYMDNSSNGVKRRLLKIHRKSLRRGDSIINYEKFEEGLRTGRFVETIIKWKTVKALSGLSDDERVLLLSVSDLLSTIDPSIHGRSIRGRLALSYVFLKYIEDGECPPIGEVMKKFKISNLSFWRIKKYVLENSEALLDKIYDLIKNKI